MRVVVVGTGTDIGKTHVSACLLACARHRGVRARAYKPVATGVDDRCVDAELHARALELAYEPPSFSYRRPVSPHLAAREEGRPIDLDTILRRADMLASDASLLLVESAGGLFSPLTDTLTNADLVLRLMPDFVLLVAPDRIGVLHDVRACVLAAKASGIGPLVIVLSMPEAPDASSGTNALELARLGLGPIAGVFPRADVEAPESQSTAARVLASFGVAR